MKPAYVIIALAAMSAAYAAPVSSAQQQDDNEMADSVRSSEDSTIVMESVSDFFLFSNEFRTIDQTSRMDMLDYYASGMKKQMATRYGGKAIIDSIAGNHYLKVITSSASETEVRMYTRKGNEKAFVVVNRVKMPAVDCSWKFYGKDLMKSAAKTDFITTKDKKQRAEIESKIPFPTRDIHFLDNGDIEIRQTVAQIIAREDSAAVLPYLKDKIVYHWDGNKFVLQK